MTEFPETRTSLLVQLKSLDDIEAWEQFISLYRPVIYRIARRRGLQEADAQDLTQRVLTSVANSIGRWEKSNESVKFRHWLRRVVKNATLNSLTRHQNQIAIGGLSRFESIQQVAGGEDSQREIELEYRREIFKRASQIVKLDVAPETWVAFEMTVVQGNSVEVAAAEIGKSIGSVYAARGRVMRRLKEAVKELER